MDRFPTKNRFRNSPKINLNIIRKKSAIPACFMAGFQLLIAVDILNAFEAYDLIDAVLSKEKQPRILNSADIELKPQDPQPLFSPSGDFNGDGLMDMAIAGIYGFPKKEAYFLLVGTQLQNPVRYKTLFFKEYSKPIFIHKPGTTGVKDPGNQAFSTTPCSDCTDGTDYHWNKERESFDLRPWESRMREYKNLPHIPELDMVSPETVDKALQIVGNLTDVKLFIAGLKKSKRDLGTRVKPAGLKSTTPATQVRVQIFEKKKGGEKLYDEILVDVESGKVLSRKSQRK
ncbi:MAG: hypothetical protein KCHDKBKB_00010 [Elusimicrobia bacterium]|nr:hypothetical protein [Elusimicrobiota bacterium]